MPGAANLRRQRRFGTNVGNQRIWGRNQKQRRGDGVRDKHLRRLWPCVCTPSPNRSRSNPIRGCTSQSGRLVAQVPPLKNLTPECSLADYIGVIWMALQVDGKIGARGNDLDTVLTSNGKGASNELGGYTMPAHGFWDASAIHVVDGGAVDFGDIVLDDGVFVGAGYGEGELRLAGVVNDVVGGDGHFGRGKTKASELPVE